MKKILKKLFDFTLMFFALWYYLLIEPIVKCFRRY